MSAPNLKAFLQHLGLSAAVESVQAHTIGATRWNTVLAGTDPATRIVNKAPQQGSHDGFKGVNAQNPVSVLYVTKAEITAIHDTAIARGLSVNAGLYNAALSEASS